ncbi:hypothetical protein HNR30_001501 [Nonomuraea soli]|uniref:VOC domain-containing protein n=2 Tax=Nonomuraea soli TaxID=1032476 RepID=A0A7W0CFE1_9ACTN|nr:hypothetical protein [Nonomuraea soli]
MLRMTDYPAGMPSWVELATPDPEAARAFYGDLFGWGGYRLSLDSFSDYEIFTLGDVQGPEVGGMLDFSDSPTASWSAYFRSDELEQTTAGVVRHGGAEVLAPADVANLGRIAICVDPQGADFALWRPYDLKGAGAMNEPSALCHLELLSPDPARSDGFYTAVFGWTTVRLPDGRTTWHHLGTDVGDVTAHDGPATWRPYFQVADCDAAAARARRLGAADVTPPSGTPLGRRSIVTDPAGATFAILEPR